MQSEADVTTPKKTCFASIVGLYARLKVSSVAFVRERRKGVSTRVFKKGASVSPYSILSEEEEQEELQLAKSRSAASCVVES